MSNRFHLLLLGVLLWSCDNTSLTRGPGTETETVQAWTYDSATGTLRPLANTLIRQVARVEWQSLIDQKMSVVFDSAWSDSLGRCQFTSRPGVAFEAAWGDSLLGWDTTDQITLRKPAAWIGTGVAGQTIHLRGTSFSSVVDSSGNWGMTVPQGTFQALSTGSEGNIDLGMQTFEAAKSNWDTTTSLGNSVLLSSTGTGRITGRWHLTWLDGHEPYADPPVFTDGDTCKAGCPILAIDSQPLPAPNTKRYGMGLEILVYGRRVRVLEADYIRIRFYRTTFGFNAFVQPGPPRTWGPPFPQMVTTPSDGSYSDEFTLGLGRGQILGGFVLMAYLNSGHVIVKEVLLESTTGVRIALEL